VVNPDETFRQRVRMIICRAVTKLYGIEKIIYLLDSVCFRAALKLLSAAFKTNWIFGSATVRRGAGDVREQPKEVP